MATIRAGAAPSPAASDPWKRLAAAILARAAKDARAGNREAAIWLLSEPAELLTAGIGLSVSHVKRWAGNVVTK